MDNKEKVLTFSLDSIKLLEEDDDISIVELRLYHLGKNLNKCDITREASDASLNSFYEKPIIYRLNNKLYPKGSTDVVEHAREEVDSTMLIAGIIPKDTTMEYQYDEENEKTYMVVTGIIYKVYQPTLTKIIENRNGSMKISIEIIITDGETLYDGTLLINKFKLRGIALLGERIPEGIEGSSLEVIKFSQAQDDLNSKYRHSHKNKVNDIEIPCELKENITTIFNKNKNNEIRFTETEFVVFNSLVDKDYCNLKELNVIKSCFDKLIKNDDNTLKMSLIEEIIEKEVNTMSLSVNELRDLLWKQLDKYKYHDGTWEGQKYYIEEIYTDEHKIIVRDNETNKMYKIEYKVSDSNKVDVLMDSKKEVKQTYEEIERTDDVYKNSYVFAKATYGGGKTITLDKTKKAMSDSAWGDVDKAAQRKEILDSPNYKTLVKSAYLEIPSDWESAPSKLGYPVMEIVGDKLVYNRYGLASAKGYAEANDDTEVLNKLKSIYKKLGLEEKEKEEVKNSMAIKKNKIDEDNKNLEEVKDDIDSDEDDEKEELEENVKKNKIEKDDKGIEGLEDDEDADKDYWKKKYKADMALKNAEISDLTAKCSAFEREKIEEKMNSLVEEYAEHFTKEDKDDLEKEMKNAKTEEEFASKVFACVAKNVKKKEDVVKNSLAGYGVRADEGYKFNDTSKKITNIKDLAKSYKGGK